MTLYVRGFVIADIAAAHMAFGRVITVAQRAELELKGTPLGPGSAATLAELRAAYVDFNDQLRMASVQAAAYAVKAMRERLAAMQVRGDTGATPHLRDLLRADPQSYGQLQTGEVGVARVADLNRAINRNSPSYGPYWRAIESGTGNDEVPSQVGRIIFGAFADAGGGGMTPPLAQYGGGGGGPHPIFLTKRPIFGSTTGRQRLRATGPGSTRSGPMGIGTIGAEIQPQRFIGVGADEAAVRWRVQVKAIEARAMQRLAAISMP